MIKFSVFAGRHIIQNDERCATSIYPLRMDRYITAKLPFFDVNAKKIYTTLVQRPSCCKSQKH